MSGAPLVHVEVGCAAAAPLDAVTAALALELAAAGWRVTGRDEATWTVRLDASPCTPQAALHITITDGGGRSRLELAAVELPERERARSIALLLADLLPPLTVERAERAERAPSPLIPPAPAATHAAAIVAPPPAVPALGVLVALTARRRTYLDAGSSGDGARLAVSASPPHLDVVRVGLDAGAAALTTPMGFTVHELIAGVQLAGHVAPVRRLDLDVAARAEAAAAWIQDDPRQTVEVPSRWLTAATATAGAELTLSASLGLRLEVEVGETLSGGRYLRTFTAADAPPADHIAPFTGRHVTLAVGLVVR